MIIVLIGFGVYNMHKDQENEIKYIEDYINGKVVPTINSIQETLDRLNNDD